MYINVPHYTDSAVYCNVPNYTFKSLYFSVTHNAFDDVYLSVRSSLCILMYHIILWMPCITVCHIWWRNLWSGKKYHILWPKLWFPCFCSNRVTAVHRMFCSGTVINAALVQVAVPRSKFTPLHAEFHSASYQDVSISQWDNYQSAGVHQSALSA